METDIFLWGGGEVGTGWYMVQKLKNRILHLFQTLLKEDHW
jgi:hypothetical protein